MSNKKPKTRFDIGNPLAYLNLADYWKARENSEKNLLRAQEKVDNLIGDMNETQKLQRAQKDVERIQRNLKFLESNYSNVTNHIKILMDLKLIQQRLGDSESKELQNIIDHMAKPFKSS